MFDPQKNKFSSFLMAYQKSVDEIIDGRFRGDYMVYYQDEVNHVVIAELAKSIYSSINSQSRVDQIRSEIEESYEELVVDSKRSS